MLNITKCNQIIDEIKAARANGETDLFSKTYVSFDGESLDLINYFESFNLYVKSMFGPDHDLNGGYLYIDWHLTNLNDFDEFS